MSNTNNGGPAFPTTDPYYAKYAGEGMSLRDYFAAKAMQGLLACPMQPQSGPDMYARDAYALADAMLKARGET
jgi:hypothetical protein